MRKSELKGLLKFLSSSWCFDIFIIAVITLFLYSFLLGAYPLILPDEGRYSDIVREMLRTHHYLTPVYNDIPFFDKPPLFYWIETFFTRLLGFNEWSLRLWPVIISTLGVIGTYITGRFLFNRFTACLSAMLLGTSFYYFLMAHVADLDMTVGIFITFSLFFSLLAFQKIQSRSICFYFAYLFSALAVLTKGLVGVILPMIVVGLWVAFLRQWRLVLKMHLLQGILLIALITVPWFYWMQAKYPSFLYYFFYIQHFHRYLANSFNSKHGLWFYPLVLLVGTLPWTAYGFAAFREKIKVLFQSQLLNRSSLIKNIPLACRIDPTKGTASVFLFLFIWIISIVLFFSIPASKTIGYIMPTFPAIALVTGSYLDEKIRLKKIKKKYLFIVLMTVLSIYLFLMLGFLYKESHHSLETSKPLAQWLRPQLSPGDKVFFYEGYYQDLALYLNHPVLLAGDFRHEVLRDNWRQDFSEGLKYVNHRVFTPDELHSLWHSQKIVYVFTTQSQVNALRKTLSVPLFPLGHYQHLWLFKN